MQVEILRDIEPPSYEESIYFKQLVGQIKAQRRKTPPPSYDNNGVFDVFRQTQLLDNKDITPSVIGKSVTVSSTETSHDDETQHDSTMDERLERVSSCLQQMIDAANQSLTSSSAIQSTSKPSKTNDVFPLDDILKGQKKKNQQWRINRQKSLEQLKSSQDRLARTMDQLNSSITQHIIDKATASTYDYTQHYHHHHHHHYYHHQTNSGSTSRKSTIPMWTNILTQATLIYGICHQLLSWSTPTSSIISVAWLVAILLVKRKFNRSKHELVLSNSLSLSSSHPSPSETATTLMSFPHLKSFLLPRYSSLLSLFRKQ